MTEGEHRVKENKGGIFTPNTLLFNAIQAKGEEVNIKTQKHWTRAHDARTRAWRFVHGFSAHLPLFRNSLLRLVPSPLPFVFRQSADEEKRVLIKKSELKVAFARKMP
jgi:hypothetical protein